MQSNHENTRVFGRLSTIFKLFKHPHCFTCKGSNTYSYAAQLGSGQPQQCRNKTIFMESTLLMVAAAIFHLKSETICKLSVFLWLHFVCIYCTIILLDVILRWSDLPNAEIYYNQVTITCMCAQPCCEKQNNVRHD